MEVDVRLEHLPGRDPPEDVDPVQFTVGTIMPEWREAETGMKATWDHRLTTKQWCGIQALFGLWTVYGQVTDTLFGWPVQYATVRAFDADIVEDDLIGSDTTDATGHYRIDYMRSTFEKTPSPWPPIELESGSDFFFSIEKGGDVLHKENRSEGRTPGREDASHCERIDLEAPTFDFLTPTLWTGIGDTFTVPSSPTDEVVPGTNTDPATESVSGSIDITSELDKTCAYSVKFWTQRRLHTGDSAVSGDGSLEEVFFYKDTP